MKAAAAACVHSARAGSLQSNAAPRCPHSGRAASCTRDQALSGRTVSPYSTVCLQTGCNGGDDEGERARCPNWPALLNLEFLVGRDSAAVRGAQRDRPMEPEGCVEIVRTADCLAVDSDDSVLPAPIQAHGTGRCCGGTAKRRCRARGVAVRRNSRGGGASFCACPGKPRSPVGRQEVLERVTSANRLLAGRRRARRHES